MFATSIPFLRVNSARFFRLVASIEVNVAYPLDALVAAAGEDIECFLRVVGVVRNERGFPVRHEVFTLLRADADF